MTRRDRSAFTLAELLLCVGLIAILAAAVAEFVRWRHRREPFFSQPLAFSPDLTILASGDGFLADYEESHHLVKLCDTATGYVSMWRGHAESVTGLAFSADGALLASGSSDGEIKLWNVRTGRERATWTAQGGLIACVALSPDGYTLAAAGEDDLVRLWNVPSHQRTLTIDPDMSSGLGNIESLALSPSGSILAIGGSFGETKLYDVATGEESATLDAARHCVSSLAFSQHSTNLATGSCDGEVRVWDSQNHQLLATMSHDGTRKPNPVIPGYSSWAVNAQAFSPDGQLLASASDDWTLNAWRMPRGEQAVNLDHTDSVVAVAFSRDGKTLATASDDGVIRFCDVGSWQLRHTAVFGTKRPIRWAPFAVGLAVWIVAWIALRRRRRSQRLARARR